MELARKNIKQNFILIATLENSDSFIKMARRILPNLFSQYPATSDKKIKIHFSPGLLTALKEEPMSYETEFGKIIVFHDYFLESSKNFVSFKKYW